MKIVILVTLLIGCTSPVISQYSAPVIKFLTPPQNTVTIHYCACTDGGDFSVDSGEVIVPEQLRQSYIDALSKRAKLYGTREAIVKRTAVNGYRVSSLRAATPASWDSLFTPPKRSSSVRISEDKDRVIQSNYWRRRYRVTGTVTGLNGACLVFKVQKALRIVDVNYEEK